MAAKMAGASTSAAGAAEGAAAKGKKGAAAAADPLIAEAAAAVLKADSVPPEKKSKMRGLVIGDSLSCDLPIDGTAVKGKSMARTLHDLTSDYECPPPTPYLAYLRRASCALPPPSNPSRPNPSRTRAVCSILLSRAEPCSVRARAFGGWTCRTCCRGRACRTTSTKRWASST